MARGWESKSVESQMEESASKRDAYSRAPLTPDQIRLETERRGLQLSRTRVLKDIESSTNERRRQQLQAALDFLDRKLANLASSKPT